MPKGKENLQFKNWILIYAVIFDVKNKKIQELLKLIEIKYESGKIYIVKSSQNNK